MSQKLQMAKPFAHWRRPNVVMRWLVGLLMPGKIVAEELPDQDRALTPALTDLQIQHLHDLLADWAGKETIARMDYTQNVERDPSNGDLYFQAYRRHCEAGEQMFRQRLVEFLNPPGSAATLGLAAIPHSEITAAMELAMNLKNWLVRCNFPSDYGSSHVACARSRWFFDNYLRMWERPRVQES